AIDLEVLYWPERLVRITNVLEALVLDHGRHGQVRRTWKESFQLAADHVRGLADRIRDQLVLQLVWLQIEHRARNVRGERGRTVDEHRAIPSSADAHTRRNEAAMRLDLRD